MTIIIDCSDSQRNVDFHKMAAAGASGVIIQMAQGTVLQQFGKVNRDNSKGVIPHAFYQFFYPQYSPVQQASAFVSACGGDYGFGLWIDVELPESVWSQAWIDQLHLMLTEVERLSGVRPGIYTRASYTDAYLASAAFLGDYPLWTANYPNAWTPGMPPSPIIPKAWAGKRWTLWQYTSEGDAVKYGCEGVGLDMSIFNGDELAWAAYIGAPHVQHIRVTGSDGQTQVFVSPIRTEAI